MSKLLRRLAGAGLFLAALSICAWAGGFLTNGLPLAGGTQYPNTLPLTGNETLPADTNLSGGLQPQSEAVTTNMLSAFGGALPGRGNYLIGGDAMTNLWQRGTTGSSVTTSATYGGPDRWFYWSGLNTAMTVSRDSASTDIIPGDQYAFLMQRTASQTGEVQMCLAQEIESVNAANLAGKTVELDFNAYTGANFSVAAPYNMTAYIVYGTGTDEGSQKMAYGLNAGGGGSVGWTNQANATAAVISLQGVSTAGRYAAVANIPATASSSAVNEVGVALCYTPGNTNAGANDYIAFSQIQLVINSAQSALANATVGYNCAAGNSIQCAAFDRRLQGIESLYQYRYYYQITEGTPLAARGLCRSRSTTACSWDIKFPAVMRAAPTMTYTAGFATETTALGGTLGACTALAADAQVANTKSSVTDAYAVCTASTVPAAGTVDQMYDNGGSGAVKASSEL